MKDTLLKHVKDFLSKHLTSEKPVLIGLSGGVDSTALFSLLLECRLFFPFLKLHAVHFDHAWRVESSQEASDLQKFVESFSIPFHLERDSQSFSEKGNLEDRARRARFDFFQRIYREVGAQAIVLAHQKEDQAETVLKRIFEGAGLFSVGGMRSESQFEAMLVWRPLLGVSRDELIEYNSKGVRKPFEDYTNKDVRFLRPRMREELFPVLERSFGKQIRSSLCRIAEEISLLRKSVENRLVPLLCHVETGRLGSCLPLNSMNVQDSFEKQELVRFFLQSNNVFVGSTVLKKVVEFLELEVSNKEFDVSEGSLLVEKGSLIWVRSSGIEFQEELEFSRDLVVSVKGKQSCFWKIERSLLSFQEKTLFRSFLEGRISYRIPKDSCLSLSGYDALLPRDKKKIASFLAQNKIPPKMRKFFPFITINGGLIDLSFAFDFNLKSFPDSMFLNIILKI